MIIYENSGESFALFAQWRLEFFHRRNILSIVVYLLSNYTLVPDELTPNPEIKDYGCFTSKCIRLVIVIISRGYKYFIIFMKPKNLKVKFSHWHA